MAEHVPNHGGWTSGPMLPEPPDKGFHVLVNEDDEDDMLIIVDEPDRADVILSMQGGSGLRGETLTSLYPGEELVRWLDNGRWLALHVVDLEELDEIESAASGCQLLRRDPNTGQPIEEDPDPFNARGGNPYPEKRS